MMHYKFTSQTEASEAVEKVNLSQGIPINYNGIQIFSVTKNYCEIKEIGGNFYIEKDSVTEAASENWLEENLVIPETDENGVPL